MKQFKLKIAFASGIIGEFGNMGKLPWGKPLKSDMSYFKEFTEGCTLLMGRKTFESLPKKLRGLTHLVITSVEDLGNIITKSGDTPDGIIPLNTCVEKLLYSLEEIYSDTSICVIGGASILEQFGPYANEVLHTTVSSTVDPILNVFPHDVKVCVASTIMPWLSVVEVYTHHQDNLTTTTRIYK